MAEKGEKEEKMEKSEKKGKGITFLQVLSLILIIALIAIVLIVVQVPYTTTNTIKETVPVENCSPVDIPFVSIFKTGLNYNSASDIYSLNGKALYRYSELNGYLFVNIRNMGEQKGVYCINAQAYVIDNFANGEDALASFENLISQDSNQTQKIDNWNSNRYTYPVCTEKPILPTNTDTISLWAASLLSNDFQVQSNIENVFILFTVVPATTEQCTNVSVEQVSEQEVIRYCNAWKHLVGKC